MFASDHNKQKSKTFIQNFSLKINWLPYHKAGLIMQYPRKYQAKKVMKFRVLNVESAHSTMSGSQSFRGSFMIPVTTLINLCSVMFAERQAKILMAEPNLLL